VTVARPHARLASRLLARLCRTGLVTRRVSMKGFTFEMILLSRASWRNVSSFFFGRKMNRYRLSSSIADYTQDDLLD
jgi:hypothetical protein